jgi:hypothetical protein
MDLESTLLEHGPGAACPTCEHAEVVEHSRGDRRHCFSCGENTFSTPLEDVDAVVAAIVKASHQQLMNSAEARRHLQDERGLHPQVVVDSAIGVIPPDLDVSRLFMPVLEAGDSELQRVLALPRNPGRPSKEEKAAIAKATSRVEKLKQAREALSALEQQTGRVAFFYTDHAHRVVRIQVEQPGVDQAMEVRLRPNGGLFNHDLFAPRAGTKSLDELQGKVIVVASEFDALQVQSLGARLAELESMRPEMGYLTIAAVGSGAVDTETLKTLGRMPLVIRNGNTLASGAQMVEEIRQRLNLEAVIAPNGESLETLLRSQPADEAAGDALLALARTKTLVTRPFPAVRAEIDDPRSQEGPFGLKKFEAHRSAGWTLVRDVTERAQLFFDGRQAYVFGKDTNGVLPVDRDNLDLQLFLNRYGVAPSDSFFTHVLHALRLEAQERGKKTTVFALSHYDVATNRVYLFDNDRHAYRISQSGVERVGNGADGVLFVRNPKWEPFRIGEPTGNAKLLTDTLLGWIRLSSTVMSREELELLFANWLYALFFPEVFPTRPILAMIGEKGSGKTSVLRRIGQVLFGPKFQVMSLSDEPKDFDAAVTGDAFVAIDNADADVKWLDDKLAVVATGGTLKRRVLYTTNQLVEFPITAFVGITSRTPHFKREDVADRLLLFHVDRLETFGAEGELLSELTAQRDVLMTELVGQVQRVLAALHENKGKSYPTTFRIADFAQFVLKVAAADGKLPEARAMFERLGDEQLAFTVQDDPVIELLEDWVIDHAGEEVTTAELFAALRLMASVSHPPRSFDFRSPVPFGQYLQSHRATLKALFGATDRTVGGRKRLWQFSAPESTETEPVEAVTAVKSAEASPECEDEDLTSYLLEWAARTGAYDQP